MINLPNVPEMLDARVQARIAPFPHHVNHASSIAAVCLRQQVYQRLNWSAATLPDVRAKRIYELGERIEKDTIIAMMEAGLQVIEQQATLSDFMYVQLTCHVDGVMVLDGAAVPFDVKSMDRMIWENIFKCGSGVYQWDEVAPGFERKRWLRKYRGQVQLYALAKNSDVAVLFCVNKSTAENAQVNCPLDLEYCEEMLKRAEAINKWVAARAHPDRIPWDADECGHCAYLHLCLPDRVGHDPVEFIPEPEIVRLCIIRETHKEAADKWEEADATVKNWEMVM